jgi:hypothetical protein
MTLVDYTDSESEEEESGRYEPIPNTVFAAYARELIATLEVKKGEK